jgi:hypothetical protein
MGPRISAIAAAALVLAAGAVGYHLRTQHRIIEPDAWGLIPRKRAFSNRYDCEVFPVGMKTGIECQALTFAQVQARASGRESDRCECWSVCQTDAARIRMRDERRAFRRPW